MVGGHLNVHMASPSVSVSIISENQANNVLKASKRNIEVHVSHFHEIVGESSCYRFKPDPSPGGEGRQLQLSSSSDGEYFNYVKPILSGSTLSIMTVTVTTLPIISATDSWSTFTSCMFDLSEEREPVCVSVQVRGFTHPQTQHRCPALLFIIK